MSQITINGMSLEAWLERKRGRDFQDLVSEEIKRQKQYVHPAKPKHGFKVNYEEFQHRGPVKRLSRSQINTEYGGAMLEKYFDKGRSRMEQIVAIIYYCFIGKDWKVVDIRDIFVKGGIELQKKDVASRITTLASSDFGMFMEQVSVGRPYIYHTDERLGVLTIDEAYMVYNKKTGHISGEELAERFARIRPLWESFLEMRNSKTHRKVAPKTPPDVKHKQDYEQIFRPAFEPGPQETSETEALAPEVTDTERTLLLLLEIFKLNKVGTKVRGFITIDFGDGENADGS